MYKKILVVNVFLFAVNTAVVAEPYVYPAKGQSNQQMEKDKYQCYGWAKQQSGYDPMNPPVQSSGYASSGGSVVGGAARGAAGGAIIGAIAGNAGKGAAIGAGVGGVSRGLRNRRGRNEAEQYTQQQSAQISQLRNEYGRAYSVCLEGRGYSVK
jgi:OmpA family protein